MYAALRYYTLGLLFMIDIITFCSAENVSLQILFFEYGTHVEGEEVSYAANGYIPPFHPVYTVNVTPLRADLEDRFTYLRVEYVSPMSTVDITYHQDTSSLSFYVRFPFITIPYGIVGYSVKVLRSHMWTSWRRRSKDN